MRVSPGGLCMAWTLALVCGSACAAGPTTSPQTMSVAILPAEVSADLSPADKKDLAASLDMLLTDALAGQEGLALIDRQELDKVVNEQTLAAKGLGKVSADEVAETLRPFWAAGVLICPAVVGPKDANRGGQKMAISVEAISAQTGQLLAELYLDGKWGTRGWEAAPNLAGQAGPFLKEMRASLDRLAGAKTVEVADGRLLSSGQRLQWVVDDLSEWLRAGAATRDGFVLLTPRRPLSTREERLLRMMGLSAPDANDAAAGLQASPDCRLTLELSEKAVAGLPFTATPIHLDLVWSCRGREPIRAALDSNAGRVEEIKALTTKWMLAQMAGGGAATSSSAEDAETCRRLAAEEVAAINRAMDAWQGPKNYGKMVWMPVGFSMGVSFRAHIARRAMRAAHLDPTNEEAAYLVAVTLDSLYEYHGKAASIVFSQRMTMECKSYFDRFARGNYSSPHSLEVLNVMAAWGGQLLRTFWANGYPPQGDENRAEAYAWARIVCPLMLERSLGAGVRRANGPEGVTQSLQEVARQVSALVFQSCPAEALDGEYAFWRGQWKRVEALGKTSSPLWETAAIGYYVAKQDVPGLRAALDTLFRSGFKIKNETMRCYGEIPLQSVREYLRQAGDKNANQWTPPTTPTQDVYSLDIRHWQAYSGKLCPPLPDAADYSKALPLPVRQKMCFSEETLRFGWRNWDSNRLVPIEPVCVATGEVWLVCPRVERGRGLGRSSGAAEDYRLYTAAMAQEPAGFNDAPVALTPIAWPPLPADRPRDFAHNLTVTCAMTLLDEGTMSVWVGTDNYGLAVFRKEQGVWHGRWFNLQDGLTGVYIYYLEPCRYDGKDQVLVQYRRETIAQPNSLAVIEPRSGQVTVLVENVRGPGWTDDIEACLPGGMCLPLGLRSPHCRPLADLKPASAYLGQPSRQDIWCSGDANAGKTRFWLLDANVFAELDPVTLSPIRRLDRQATTDEIFFDRFTRSIASDIWFTHQLNWFWKVAASPTPGLCLCAPGNEGAVWGLVRNDANYLTHHYLMGYLPPADPNSNWAANDRCFGPFAAPDGTSLSAPMAVSNDEMMIASTGGHVYVVSAKDLMAAADKAGLAFSTDQWRQDYLRRLGEAGWQGAVRCQMAQRQWEDALATLTEAGESPETKLYRALILARLGGRDEEALTLYASVIDDTNAEPPARAVALVNRIRLSSLCRRWQEVLDAADRLVTMFPRMRPGETSDGLEYRRVVDEARAKLGLPPAAKAAANP